MKFKTLLIATAVMAWGATPALAEDNFAINVNRVEAVPFVPSYLEQLLQMSSFNDGVWDQNFTAYCNSYWNKPDISLGQVTCIRENKE